jgi:hypothetical protein
MKSGVLGVIYLAGLLSIGFASQKPTAFTGEILDLRCATAYRHLKDAEDCTLKARNGATFVLFDAATKAAYQLDNQKKPKSFAGQKVWVSGTLDEATQTIHVKGIGTAAGVQNVVQWGVRFR